MARIRTVKPELFTDADLATCSVGARWLFVGLFTEADDKGRLIDSPKRIAGAVFPHEEGVTAGKVKKWLDELEAIDCVRRYTAGTASLIWLPNFLTHQKIAHPTPSKLPAHPHDKDGDDSRPPPDSHTNGSRNPHEKLPSDSRSEVEVGSGSRKKEVEGESSSSPSDLDSPSAGGDDDESPDWALNEARRRLAARPPHLPAVLDPDHWLAGVAGNVARQGKPETDDERHARIANDLFARRGQAS